VFILGCIKISEFNFTDFISSNKPYHLHTGDCLPFIQTLPDNSVDLIYTDPPYFSTDLHFDKEPRIDFKAHLLECKRVLKPHGILVAHCDLNLLIELRSFGLFKSSYELIWHKIQTTNPFDANVMPLRQHEYILVMVDGIKKATYNPQKTEGESYQIVQKSSRIKHLAGNREEGLKKYDGLRFPCSVLSGFYDEERQNSNVSDKARHPTQKPLSLAGWLIKTYSNEGDIILDPFAGSGTSGAAGIKLKRKVLLCEKFEDYAKIAQRRCENALNDIDVLFG
jgi:site-specific DNA-methyltransferase (adenine-specific)